MSQAGSLIDPPPGPPSPPAPVLYLPTVSQWPDGFCIYCGLRCLTVNHCSRVAGEETEVSDGEVFWGILSKLVKVTRLDLKALDVQSMALQMMPLAHF